MEIDGGSRDSYIPILHVLPHVCISTPRKIRGIERNLLARALRHAPEAKWLHVVVCLPHV